MYEDEPTYRDPLDAVEEALAVQAHSPRFWDADNSQMVGADPYEHPSWDVHEALNGDDGWDDPAVAVEVREQLADDVRLLPLAETPTARPVVRDVDQVLADRYLTPEEELHTALLALVSVDTDGYWPAADDYGERGAAA
ncbi:MULTISPECIES: hypothetical protein [unclassified Nocardiopsis]|uniref:hypothetical protein n=1 Tax=unclassified Nocardiopsis TaxID=2649073 RepID=UPI00135CAE0D|nr:MULTISPECIES: hypothetical protein [unclassified Nocardiopsis]